jgi:Fe(3+) dicitrate transport protein
MPICRPALLTCCLALIAAPALSTAESDEILQTSDSDPAAVQASTPTPPPLFDRLTVTGGPDRVQEIPGSATYLSPAVLTQQRHTDIHRVLRQVPGVNIQEEDGYGLRPNIGMRGTGVERSEKITILEDGILIAPAPYSAPAAYYFPTIGRMEAVEVRKGSTAIRQGPYTTGGALNLISTSIPSQLGGLADLAWGQDSTLRGRLMFGDSRERFGWMLETYQHSTDGFKRLDGGGSTGFTLGDYMGKVRWSSAHSATIQQTLELKLGHTRQKGDETYLGLTARDFALDPFRRYAASAADVIDTEHEQIQIRHLIAPSARLDLTTTIYQNDFYRNWHKLDSIGGVSIANILDQPETHATLLAITRGELDDPGSLRVRNNRRDYFGRGIQSVLGTRFATGAATHSLELGIRRHDDGEDRFQEDDRYAMISGRLTFLERGAPGSNANRVTRARATALFVQDEIRWQRWAITPGFRVESIDFEVRDFGRNDPDRTGSNATLRTNSVDAFVPGIGIAYLASPELSLFGGIHKGFAPPGAGANAETRAEESTNYEAGVRWSGAPLRAEVIGFLSDYDNLLGRDTLSSGGTGTGDLYNGGAVEVRGLEMALDRTFAAGASRFPLRLAYTWTEARFRNSFETSFADWAPRVTAGDELPYIPEHQWTVSAGLERGRWSAHTQLAWSGAMRTQPGRGAIPAGSGTDSWLTTDLTIGYSLLAGVEIFAQGRNLTDETYIVARRPAGLRPGMPRTLMTGLTWKF